jgi:DNA ligase 1
LDSVKVKVGTPVIPALCQRLNSAEEIIEKMGEVYAEPKYDGTRVQLHYKQLSVVSSQLSDGKSDALLKTFTRNLEESSLMFPELAEAVKTLRCESCILDAEAVGYDPKTGKLMLFQQTMQRKRKHGIEELSKDIPLRFFVFDILEKDGESLIQMPLSQRKAVLKKVFKDNEYFVHSPFLETEDSTVLHEYHVEQLALGLEGVVIKKTTSVYQSGRKGYSWVKIKEAEGTRGKLSDTVDAIVMGYFHAKGARTDFGVGSLLLGILNEEVAKEIMLKTKELKVKDMPKTYQVIKNLIPDVWITPEIVIEVAADEITISQVHTAGLALRFPRFVKFRDDKGWADATTLKELKTIVVS